jgi:hypothetical protein
MKKDGQIVQTSHWLRFVINNIHFVGRPIFPWSPVISAVENTCVTVEWLKEPYKLFISLGLSSSKQAH